MREARLFLFVLVGILLGGGCSVVFAAAGTRSATSMGMGFNVHAPSNVAVSGFYDAIVPGFDWTYDHYSSADTKISRAANGAVGGAPLSGTASRVVSAGNIAKVGVKLAKLSGPVSLGLTLADLIWDEVAQQWQIQDGDPNWHDNNGAACLYPGSDGYMFDTRWTGQGLEVPGTFTACAEWDWMVAPAETVAGWTRTNNWFINAVLHGIFRRAKVVCSAGQIVGPDGTCQDSQYRPATDAEIEDAIYVELVARGMSSDLARRLIDAGYAPDLLPGSGPSFSSGPASLTGPSSTSTTQTQAGPVTTVTNTTYNVTYNNQTVNVTETTTTTKTNPDNTTETTTETKTPAPTTGEEPAPDVPPEQPPEFCELHPESIVCQEMDTPEENKPNPTEKTFSITPSGGFGGDGSCPADVGVDFLGQPITWSFQPACDFMTGVRPAVIAMAWVAAILIALGGYRKGD